MIRRRSVFGVVDDDELPSRAGQRNVERPRLGLRRAWRRDDDLVAGGQTQARQPAQGLGVPLLDDQLDVEFALGIIEPIERADQVLDDARFPIKRDDDGVVGQLIVGERGRTSSPLPAIADIDRNMMMAEKVSQSAADATACKMSNRATPWGA